MEQIFQFTPSVHVCPETRTYGLRTKFLDKHLRETLHLILQLFVDGLVMGVGFSLICV